MRYFKRVELTGVVQYRLYARIAELGHFTAVCADKVVMLLRFKSLFELGDVLSELMLYHKLTVEQQVYRVVKRCAAHTVVLIFHEDIQRLDIEMAVPRVDLIKYGIPLGSLPVPVTLKIFCEDLFYGIFGFSLIHIQSH